MLLTVVVSWAEATSAMIGIAASVSAPNPRVTAARNLENFMALPPFGCERKRRKNPRKIYTAAREPQPAGGCQG